VRFAITQRPGGTVSLARFQIAPVNAPFPGSVIRTFPPFGKDWASGEHGAVLSWDGTDDQGRRAPTGRYRLYAEQQSTVALTVTCADGSGQGIEEHTGTQWSALGYLKVVGSPR
jgi:flagellar hook assembly protein FlgD